MRQLWVEVFLNGSKLDEYPVISITWSYDKDFNQIVLIEIQFCLYKKIFQGINGVITCIEPNSLLTCKIIK